MMRRVSRGQLPRSPRKCGVHKACVYKDADGVCDSASINKGNSDAACHRMNNRDVLSALETAGQCLAETSKEPTHSGGYHGVGSKRRA